MMSTLQRSEKPVAPKRPTFRFSKGEAIMQMVNLMWVNTPGQKRPMPITEKTHVDEILATSILVPDTQKRNFEAATVYELCDNPTGAADDALKNSIRITFCRFDQNSAKIGEVSFNYGWDEFAEAAEDIYDFLSTGTTPK